MMRRPQRWISPQSAKQFHGVPRPVASVRDTQTPLLLTLVLFSLICLLALPVQAQVSADPTRPDPARITGPDACGTDCHKDELAIWKKTLHGLSFDKITESKKYKEIKQKLNLTNMKTDETCIDCHFTPRTDKTGKTRLITGVGCESCHGEGKDWFEIHGDYGGKNVTREQETEAHRKDRLAKSDAAGWIRPRHTYTLIRRCYDCHMVMDEKTVNNGGHLPLSDIEPVNWTQNQVGDHPSIRHNVNLTKKNDIADPARRRVLYVLGVALNLEYSLRGLGRASNKGAYAKAMALRAKDSARKLAALAKKAPLAELKAMMATARKVRVKLGQPDFMNGLADELKVQSKKFATNHDGTKLAAIDSLIPWLPPRR